MLAWLEIGSKLW